MITRLLIWLHGWRRDLDGWYVRARKESDPDPWQIGIRGFVEEACIAVSLPEEALFVDRYKGGGPTMLRWVAATRTMYFLMAGSENVGCAKERSGGHWSWWIFDGASQTVQTLEAAKFACEAAFRTWCKRAGMPTGRRGHDKGTI